MCEFSSKRKYIPGRHFTTRWKIPTIRESATYSVKSGHSKKTNTYGHYYSITSNKTILCFVKATHSQFSDFTYMMPILAY